MTHPFAQVVVRYAVTGGSRVDWRLEPEFADSLPHTFTLQGAYGTSDNAGWIDLGLPAENTYYLVDDGQRIWGESQDWRYRVQLETENGTYLSDPVSATSGLDFHSWRIGRDIIRKEKLRHRQYTGLRGHWFKRRRYGPVCPRCVEPMTDAAADSHCPVCFGVGLDGGFYAAEYGYLELPQSATEAKLDVTGPGSVDPHVVQGCRILGDPRVDAGDLFADGTSDRIFVVKTVEQAAIMRGHPLVATVTVRLADFSDVVYTLTVPDCPEDCDGYFDSGG